MATYFTPPIVGRRPPVAKDTPWQDQLPALYFGQESLVPWANNLFVLADGVTVVTTQPRFYSDCRPDLPDAPWAYLGGHIYGPLTQSEINLLTNAGYSSGFTTSDPDGGVVGDSPLFGGGGYGEGSYGS